MLVKILKESGYNEALLGVSLSRNQPIENMPKVAQNLFDKQMGHNKFLESIYVWIDIVAPRFWWAEADTYRLSTKQSESTMYTLNKRHVTKHDFEKDISDAMLLEVNKLIDRYNSKEIDIDELKNGLPEGFLQRRIWVMSYKTLQNIYLQRKNHRLPQWKYFCSEIKNQLEHSNFLERESND
jgi:hypothetical protein